MCHRGLRLLMLLLISFILLLNMLRTRYEAGEKELNFIRRFEGIKYKVYPDYNNRPTIGIGHLIKPNEKYLLTATLNYEKAVQLFYIDIAPNVKWLNEVGVLWEHPITHNEFTALLSFLHQYNIHSQDYTNTRLAIISGDRDRICTQLMTFRNSKKGNGDNKMLERRKQEIDLFLIPDAV